MTSSGLCRRTCRPSFAPGRKKATSPGGPGTIAKRGGDPAGGLDAWARLLAGWAIPEEILSRAPEPPWTLPADTFGRRADVQLGRGPSLASMRAGAALRPRGSVLDIGAGAGAASLPLAGWTTRLVAVEGDPAMLAQLRPRAAARGVDLVAVEGTWPDVAGETPACDVTVCGHVLYNVPQLAPFLQAMAEHARRRVVIEITAAHPAGGLNPLWERFHGLTRPRRPNWRDAVRALQEAGLRPRVEHEVAPAGRPPTATFDELVGWTRRRLCLGADRDPEVAEALTQLGAVRDRPESWSLRPAHLVVLWWDTPGGEPSMPVRRR